MVTGSWALGVQSFPEPYNKFTSILAPGIGYISGHTLQYSMLGAKNIVDWIGRKRAISNINKSISALRAELRDAKENKLNETTVNLIKELLDQAHEKRVHLIAHSIQPSA